MITVLLTGAGGVAIPSLIDHLRQLKYRVLSADMNPHAPGLFLADAGFVVPAGTSRDFLTAVAGICLREHVNVLVPLVDEELVVSLEMEKQGVSVLLPRREFVVTALDKCLLMERLRSAGIPVPETRLASEGRGPLSFPLVVKPRVGRGSRGLAIVGSDTELADVLARSDRPLDEVLLQRFIGGPEYTVSVVAWRDGEVQSVVPKEIISKKGVTHIAVTRHNERIDALCRLVQEKLRADGPFNIQLRLNPADGAPLPFEINPRFSTTVTLTIAAGVDEVGALVAQAAGAKRKPFGSWKEGLVLLRRARDEFLDEAEFRSRAVQDVSGGSST